MYKQTSKLLWLMSGLLLLPFALWMGGEFSAIAGNDANQAPAVRALEESTVPGCLFAWSSSDAVSRGRFTRQVDRNKREPVDQVCQLSSDEKRIFYFSDLHNQQGKQIFHLWEYQGREMAKVALGTVKGARWRVWSSKNLIASWSGTWVLKVVTKEGSVLHQDQFEYGTL
ncbi:MAG: DUF2914 domain-containing protein [Gammaproteobacteria bacterium]|jgi:hypothetical protein|nr:DUF2914 domain-containing protein [Gammaproteobacteria bacterium]MBT4607188.1 DUF2914 domain-containing protein [Thiotrichales bacterium]MBT3472617.1 DUF2914 domain-containing protein [Gammaproteobacteria bacterium]MBT4329048.1 DUF2914 domain-containing protein [Gammaproteobacteria bacterium]MBT4812043.1 DUF2914 domain-containing protein [Thiotrichales bacterium]